MLSELHLEDFVLFRNASLVFGPGLTVVSGETGSGKSLLVEALSLLLGARARSESIRSGADRSRLTAAFDLSAADGLAEALRALEIEPDEEGQLLIERTLRRDAPSRLAVGGRPVTAQTVRSAAECLLDIAAQNEHSRLHETAYQRQILDRFGGLSPEADAYAEAFRRAASLARRLTAGDAERARVAQRLREVRQNLADLRAAAYDADTDADLEQRIQSLSNASAITELAVRGEEVLYEGEEAVQDRLGALARECADLAGVHPPFRETVERLDAATAEIGEAVRTLRLAAEDVDAAPGALEEALERAEFLKRLARRFGVGPEELPGIEARLAAEEEELADWGLDTEALRSELARLLAETARLGKKLRRSRERAASGLARAVAAHLADLGMPRATFDIALRPLWSEEDPAESLVERATAEGLEEVIFRIAPNPGEPLSELARTASGGEMARAMLAIKCAVADVHTPPVLLFDEIDAGIGGRLGDAVGRKLRELARGRQVIAITHLPQIAAYAGTHLKVTKNVRKGRTVAEVACLEGDARVEEMAEMIQGARRSETTRRQAEEMLARGTTP